MSEDRFPGDYLHHCEGYVRDGEPRTAEEEYIKKLEFAVDKLVKEVERLKDELKTQAGVLALAGKANIALQQEVEKLRIIRD